ncbi:hypothetical protein [Microbacterium amylolyticum]|uniref:Uncharacterized protein with FMN-binding domain n=1 Tax=Microbacterium amylolyticum TaxID=936337 RepID=A0ABS4ZK60_9MICO|nr:hypothetical protein [Microbacterium amylolyticum]MBP2437680.1 uncharacterized protein with FMN-binding domain [Microbacterium amylolyticum]
MNRTVRASAAFVGVAGIMALAGCGAATPGASGYGGGQQTDITPTETGYADGTYSAEGTYQTPETVETVEVTVDVQDSVVTSVEVVGDPQATESRQFQGQFIDGIADEVVGQPLDEINVSRVAGSSLTSGGFNQAIEQIKQDAEL